MMLASIVVLVAVVLGPLLWGAAHGSVGAVAAKQCSDLVDNDLDGLIDFPADPGCGSPNDNSEADPAPPPAPATPPAPAPAPPPPPAAVVAPPPPIVIAPPPPALATGSSTADATLLTPFPVVRLRGTILDEGARVTRLTVAAPVGSLITIRCRGRVPSCPRATTTRLMTRRIMRMRSFERRILARTVLRIYVTKPDVVGKYTRFTIRRGQAPSRVDACARPDITSLICP